MKLKFNDFTEDNAKETCTWKYEGKYSSYGCPEWSTACEKKWGLTIEEIRKKEYKSVIDEEGNLCGYVRFCYQEAEDAVLIGLGLKPSLCGHGAGRDLMDLIKKYCSEAYRGKKLILDVHINNDRAIKCYERAGFKSKGVGLSNIFESNDYIRMEYEK